MVAPLSKELKSVTLRPAFSRRVPPIGRNRHIGYFPSPDLAQAAYMRESIVLNGEFARAE